MQNNPCVLLAHRTQGNSLHLFFNITKIAQYLELGLGFFLSLLIVIASSLYHSSPCANICLYVIAYS